MGEQITGYTTVDDLRRQLAERDDMVGKLLDNLDEVRSGIRERDAEIERLTNKLSRFSELQYKRLDEAVARIAELEAELKKMSVTDHRA